MTLSSSPLDHLLAALERHGQMVRRGGPRGGAVRTARAQCPAHGSRSLTLSLCETAEGAALLHCHAGCAVDGVLAAVGLQPVDLYPARAAQARSASAASIGIGWRGVAAAADQLEDAARNAGDPALAHAARGVVLQARAAMRSERRMHQ
ncbi:hypothetical protein [Metallibacterium scheffleri]